MTERTCVKITVEDRVALVTIDRPPVNALNRPALAELASALDELMADDGTKVVILTGAGERAFVAGADIAELAALADATAGRAFARLGQALCDQIEHCPKPVIAAINGVALGGGLELALACHIRIVADRARLGQTECNLGLIPGWGATQRLPRLIGIGRAIELILTGNMIPAQEAFRLGLANRVVPADQLLAEARALGRQLADKSRLTNAAALRAITAGLELPLADGLALEAEQFAALFSSHDLREGLAAFQQKRPPKFADY